ncbi:uncharacterized, partial [Tachysurus ichikawai]
RHSSVPRQARTITAARDLRARFRSPPVAGRRDSPRALFAHKHNYSLAHANIC